MKFFHLQFTLGIYSFLTPAIFDPPEGGPTDVVPYWHGARSVGVCDMIMWNGFYDYVISVSVIIADFMIWLYKVIIEDLFSHGDYRWGWVFVS